MLKTLLESKKFIGFVIGLVLEIVVASGLLGLTPEMAESLMAWIGTSTGTYVVGQGIADHGKEKAKIEKGTP